MKLRTHLFLLTVVTIVPIVLFAIGLIAYHAHVERRSIERGMRDTSRALALALDRDIGDPERLRQVVDNLVGNAIKFTPAGGHVAVALVRDAAARLVVTDDGTGIAQGFLPHVFERFRQDDRTSAGTQAGLGLGLAIVRHLVELHGGRVSAESAGEGQGATFTVTLPIMEIASKETT